MKSLLKLSLAGLTTLMLIGGAAFLPSPVKAFTMGELLAGDDVTGDGEGIFVVGDKTFADFTCTDTSIGDAGSDCDSIVITPDDTAPFGWDAVVVSFSGDGEGAVADIFITYTVTATGGLISDLELSFDGSVIETEGSALISITETVSSTCPGDIPDCSSGGTGSNDLLVSPLVVTQDGINLSFNTVDLLEAVDFIYVTKNIKGEVFSDGANFQLSSFGQKFSQTEIPEPATLGLFGIGLAGLGFLMRRRRKTAAK